jgi:type II secretory pathway pseudopilin PulG
MTLVEMLVAMALLLIVFAAIVPQIRAKQLGLEKAKC